MEEKSIDEIKLISIIGGTGKEGKGLAYAWAKAGYSICIGSRQLEKAQAAAGEVTQLLNNLTVPLETSIVGNTNPEAARMGDLVVLTVPYLAHVDTLNVIKPFMQGKILIDVTVPLVPPKVTKVQMPPAGSAAQEAQLILGDGVQVVTAFQNISHENLLTQKKVECDVLVCGSGKSARGVVLELVKAAGLSGWDAGPIENSVVVEGLTSILIGINKQYNTESAGIRITGVPRE